MKILFVSVACLYLSAANASVSFHDALESALEKHKNLDVQSIDEAFTRSKSPSWIDANPSVSLLHWEKQDERGASETELMLNLPIKSSLRKKFEADVLKNTSLMQNITLKQRKLLLSEYIRNLTWRFKRNAIQERVNNQKITKLNDIVSAFTDLFERNALPKQTLMLLKLELHSSRLTQLELEHNSLSTVRAYQKLTGLNEFPDDLQESFKLEAINLNQHPSIQMLRASWRAYEIAVFSQQNSAEPWQVQLGARHIDDPDFSETQVGIGIEIPIGVGNNLSLIQSNEWRSEKLDYETTLYQMYTQIESDFAAAVAQLNFLKNKQEVLDDNLKNITDFEFVIEELLQSNAPNRENNIRHLITLIEAKQEIQLNRLAIREQISNIHQIAGIPL
uniref:TolC family protein n=1 Tax=Ningiella ruwaisensis TaxID=2364274 RepID=UPI001446F1FA|nr:TolC family protein [Ningiella ruwaisensis]